MMLLAGTGGFVGTCLRFLTGKICVALGAAALLITGFCGGFTTFSSFSHDMLGLIEQRQYLYFVLYAALSFVLGLVMVWAGREVVMRSV